MTILSARFWTLGGLSACLYSSLSVSFFFFRWWGGGRNLLSRRRGIRRLSEDRRLWRPLRCATIQASFSGNFPMNGVCRSGTWHTVHHYTDSFRVYSWGRGDSLPVPAATSYRIVSKAATAEMTHSCFGDHLLIRANLTSGESRAQRRKKGSSFENSWKLCIVRLQVFIKCKKGHGEGDCYSKSKSRVSYFFLLRTCSSS